MRSLTALEEEEFQSIRFGRSIALTPSPTSKRPLAPTARREGETLIEFVFRLIDSYGLDQKVIKASAETSDPQGRVRTQSGQALRKRDGQSSKAA